MLFVYLFNCQFGASLVSCLWSRLYQIFNVQRINVLTVLTVYKVLIQYSAGAVGAVRSWVYRLYGV